MFEMRTIVHVALHRPPGYSTQVTLVTMITLVTDLQILILGPWTPSISTSKWVI